jgi:hypothetical protein
VRGASANPSLIAQLYVSGKLSLWQNYKGR